MHDVDRTELHHLQIGHSSLPLMRGFFDDEEEDDEEDDDDEGDMAGGVDAGKWAV
jgi:hypothetical protein